MSTSNPIINSITQEEAEAILAPYYSDFQACIRIAWESWQHKREHNADEYSMLSTRTRANWIFDAIRKQANLTFKDKPNITINNDPNKFFITFHDQITARFKKLSNNLRPSNIQTYQQLSLSEQLPLQGIPSSSYVTVGYVLNSLGTDITSFNVVHIYKSTVLWSVDLKQDATETAIELPLEQPEPIEVKLKTKIKRREEKSK